MTAEAERCFCSWSGGKDSCLALHRAIASGLQPAALVTMLVEDGKRSRSHGLTTDLLERQATSLGMRLITRNTSWDHYETSFLDAVRELRDEGISVGVFGDIDLREHREWGERVCSLKGVRAVLPLWGRGRRDLLLEFLSLGFHAIIVSVRDGVLDKDFLGKTLNPTIIEEMMSIGIDASGEMGEYHTLVTNGPIFSQPITPKTHDIHHKDGYWFLDVE